MTESTEKAAAQLNTNIERIVQSLNLMREIKGFDCQQRDTQLTSRGRARAKRIVDEQWKRKNRPKPQKESKGFGS